MNTKVAFGLCAAFLLGVFVGHFEQQHFGKAPSHVPVPRASSAAEVRGGDRDGTGRLTYIKQEPAVGRHAGAPSRRIEDLATVFTTLLALPESDTKLANLKSTFTQWLLSSPVQAMSAAQRMPIELREAVVPPALAKLAEQQPALALSVLSGVTESYATYASAILSVLARSDPRRALEWATQNQESDPGGETMRAIIPVLAPTHLDMAAQAIAAMADGASVSLIQQVAAEYAARDPQQAYAWARGLAQGRSPAVADEIVNGVGAALAARSVDEAVAFLNQTVDPQIRSSLIREIANRKSEADLREAWRWLNQYSADATYRENARNLLYRWSYLRPEEVANLLQNVTDSELRAAAARELSLQWQRRDADAWQAWVAALPPGPLKSAMLIDPP